MNSLIKAAISFCLLACTNFAEGKSIRATEMDSVKWSQLYAGELQDLTIEFRQGDELPMTFVAEGDLFATTHSPTNYIGIKRNFWLKASNNSVVMSLDGVHFKPINEIITGSLTAGAGQDQDGGSANSILVNLKAFLR